MIGILPCRKISSVLSMGGSYAGFSRVALMLLRKAMDMKLAIIVHKSNSPLPAKPGEKNDCSNFISFVFLVVMFLWKLMDKCSAVRVPRGNMKMRKLSRGVSTPYI